MKDLLDKISSYNLFNNLFPGILFAVLSKEITSFSFLRENILEGLFVYYFLGLIISKIGSLIIEPILKTINFIKFYEYEDLVNVSAKDSKIEILSEVNNTFRTLCSLFFVLILLKIYEQLKVIVNFSNTTQDYIIIILLFLLFLISYKKQTNYIKKRIKITAEIKNKTII